MRSHKILNTLPEDIQLYFMATLEREEGEGGHFYLTGIEQTEGGSSLGQRITVQIFDENGFPIPGVHVAFSFSTAPRFILGRDFTWRPPAPYKADIFKTNGAGQVDQVQGSTVKEGEPGGVTVYVFEPEFSSDVVSGLGMLSDHSGLFLTFQLRRPGVVPIADKLSELEARVSALEAGRFWKNIVP